MQVYIDEYFRMYLHATLSSEKSPDSRIVSRIESLNDDLYGVSQRYEARIAMLYVPIRELVQMH